MFILFNINIFLIIVISIVFVSALDERQSKSDDMCGVTRSVLCVKDILMVIATVAKSINRTANEIEKHIFQNARNTNVFGTLNRYFNFEVNVIRSHLPTPQLHVHFVEKNNIDKKYLVDLFLEAHYAMSFYYNSIDDIINTTVIPIVIIDSWFEQIRVNLRNEIICRYRSILDVYSSKWPSINEIKRIKFSARDYPDGPSVVHDVHSIIVARLVREWMGRIHSVIISLERKFV